MRTCSLATASPFSPWQKDTPWGAVVACGDGFLLTEHFPWEWQQPARSSLSHLALDGTRTVLAPELIFPRGDSALLIPIPDEHHAAVILRDADAHRLQTFGH